jgi:subtilisin family serine protease
VSDENIVHILSARPEHNYLADIYNPKTSRFRRLKAEPLPGGLTGKGQVACVIDTGVLSTHPVIRARLVDAVDFTGEGQEDENGHGSLVALLLLLHAPDASLISVKAVRRDGRSRVGELLKALRWVRDDKRIKVVNLSAGVYRPDCTGHCTVCEAARKVVAAGKLVCVAAGNLPGITACPAKASDAVLTVGAFDPESGSIASYSSPATKDGVLQSVSPQPAEWVDAEGKLVGN